MCAEREATVEGLINLALRLQAYGRGTVHTKDSVRRACGEALSALRLATLEIIESVAQWLAVNEYTQAARIERQLALEAKRQAIMAAKHAKKAGVDGAALPPPTAATERYVTPPAGAPRGANFASAHAFPASAPGAVPSARTGVTPGGAPAMTTATTPAGGAAGTVSAAKLPRSLAPPPLFSAYSLKFACHPPADMGKTREAPGLWDGLNYILKITSDVWRLPLPTMSDPFGLRWFQGTEYDAASMHHPTDVLRMMAAETSLRRMLPREHSTAMEAVESTIAIRMLRPPSAGVAGRLTDRPSTRSRGGVGGPTAVATSESARRLEAEAERANWRVLSNVIYPPDGARVFASMKRQQWKDAQQAAKVQCFVRQCQFSKRVQKRVVTKQEKAAKVVQYYYRNRLQLGHASRAFAIAVETKQREVREEEARRRAERRALQEKRLEEQMGRAQRKAQRDARARALSKALVRHAAVDTLQSATRRCLGVLIKRRLRHKRAVQMRPFTNDSTGHNMKLLVQFQRRVKLWLQNNQLFHACYEDHRRFLQHEQVHHHFEAIEADLAARRKATESAISSANDELTPHLSATTTETDLRVRLAEMQGELMALQGFGMDQQKVSETSRRNAMASASAALDGMRGRVEGNLRERCALQVQSERAQSAASLADELLGRHPMLLPWLMGQAFVFREHARLSLASVTRVDATTRSTLEEAKTAACKMHLNNPQSLALSADESAKRQRIQQLDAKAAQLKRDVNEAAQATRTYERLSIALAGLRGSQWLLGLLEQLCGWRSWQHARGLRVSALTTLRGTRSHAKREKALALDYAEASAKDAVFAEFGRFASAPACQLTIRPVVKRKLMNCDLARLTAAFTKHLATDLTHALGVQVGTIQVTHVPDEKATQVPSDAGLSMQTDAGAADFEINFGHQDGVEESDLPIELLRRVEHGLSSGDVPIPNVFSAFGSTAAGGAATLSDVEIRIRSKNAPTPEEIVVRTRLKERAEALTKAAAQSRDELANARREKQRAKNNLAPGEAEQRTRDLKIAVRAASGAQSACDYLISELPERFPGDEKEIQFEWLPDTVRAARRELAEQNAKLVEGLEQVTMAVQARTIGKKQRLHVDKMMASLREQQLPLVKPPLEDSGSLSLHSLHEEFYHSRDLLAGRRALSVAVAKYAAKLDVESTQQMSLLEVQANEEKGRARKVKSKRGRLALDPGVTLSRVKALMLLSPAEPDVLTPERVMAMAERLGIVLASANAAADAEPEYCLLWIAVEALRAPLPPLWRRSSDGRFEHSVTHETTDEHPLLPAFLEHVEHERARKRTNRPFSNLERFMLFADPRFQEGGSGSPNAEGGFIFYNFATRQALPARRLPAEAVAEQAAKRPPPPPPKKRVHRHTENTRNARHRDKVAADQAQLEAAAAAAEKAAKETPKADPLSKDELAVLKAQAAVVRRAALTLRPRGLPEIMMAARMFGIDLVNDPTLLWLVDLCLAADYLPSGWTQATPDQMVSQDAPPKNLMHSASSLPGMGETQSSGIFTFGEQKREEPRQVSWLPPMERLWTLAMTGAQPVQYTHQMCSLTTERHPVHGFVRWVLGVDAKKDLKFTKD